MSQFTEPVEKLVQDSKSYLDSQLEGFKLRIVKGLSEATRGLGELLVVLTVAGMLTPVSPVQPLKAKGAMAVTE